MTSKFIGRTAHAEYLYSGFGGHWIGPYGDGSDITMAEYDGYLRASSEQNIYDPGSGVSLHFEDCYEGFVCIRSRWREDDISGSGNNPDSRYLQVYRVGIKERYNVQCNCDSPCSFSEFLCLCGAQHICSI